MLRELKNNPSVAVCALRFGMHPVTVRRYAKGERGGPWGRPRSLTPEQEQVVCEVFRKDEATVYELASVMEVTPQTIRNILKRHDCW